MIERGRKNGPVEIQAREGTEGKAFSEKFMACKSSICVEEAHLLFSHAPSRGHACGGLGRQLRLSLPHDDRPLVVHSPPVCHVLNDHESA